MAAHGFQNGGDKSTELPDVMPFNLPYLTRLSWELGSQIVEDDDSILRGKWEHTEISWNLSIFHVTSNTVIMQIRTPVGRKRFYGAAQSDVRSALSPLDAAPDWQQRK